MIRYSGQFFLLLGTVRVIMGDLTILETLHELYISLTALMFDIALLIVVVMQGGAKKDGNRRYVSILVAVTCSIALSITSFFLQHADIGAPLAISLLVHLLAYMGNTLVAYYMVQYLSGFFPPDAISPGVRKFNRLLLLVPAAMMVVYYFVQMPRFSEPGADVFAHGWFRAMVGYVFDLYYMIFCLLLLRYRQSLSKRARYTIISAFLLTAIAFAMQALLGSRPLVNYVGASLGLLIFYFAAETPDYKKLQEALHELEAEKHTAEEAKAQADAANRSKSDFLANMSHEIRTPINAVLGMNEMILRESTNENVRTYAHNVDSAGKNLLAIINDILDFSKIEAGRMELVEAPYSLSSVLNDVCNMVSFRAGSKHLAFAVTVDENMPDRYRGDEVRVRQIITNLLNNAVKYTEQGTVSLDVRFEEPCLVVSVKDTGIGIREEDRKKLFSKFERVDLEHTNTIEGTGLGLAITGNLLSLMQGKITVESEYGKGSTFTAQIPQEVLSSEPVGDFQEKLQQAIRDGQTYHEAFRAPGARVLVVDDTEMNLVVMEGLLKQTMVLLELASSGAQALKLAQDTRYDLILMDQRMPEMDGTQTLQNIRKQEGGANRSTPVICLTADAVQGARDRYLKEGFTDYLSKPVEGRALEQTLIKYLPVEKVVFVPKDAQAFPEAVIEETPGIRAVYDNVPSLAYGEAIRLLATEQLVEKTLRQFLEDALSKAEEIERYYKEEDWENYTILVHALKSSARMIGAGSLSEAAAYLEQCGNAAR